MKRSDAFPSKFLGQGDATTPITATIAKVYKATLGQGEDAEEKTVIDFHGNVKSMVLNGINWMICEELYGDDSDGWIGKPIEVYADPNVMFGNKRVGGLRLRKPSGNTNGHYGTGTNFPAGGAWTWAQALQEIAHVGGTAEDLIDYLKTNGATGGYKPERDTPTVKNYIDNCKLQAAEPSW